MSEIESKSRIKDFLCGAMLAIMSAFIIFGLIFLFTWGSVLNGLEVDPSCQKIIDAKKKN